MSNPNGRKGASFERTIADYLGNYFDDGMIDRRIKHGSNDTGDITGFHWHCKRVVVECKSEKNFGSRLADYVQEAEIERGNDDAFMGVTVVKRPKYGNKHVGGNYVVMTLDTFLKFWE